MLNASYNFDHSENENQTFDVSTYGNSANGIEGPSKINVANLNFFTTISPTKLNELHVTYAANCGPATPCRPTFPQTRDGRARLSFGNPYFLSRASTSCSGARRSRTTCRSCREITFKIGGEWLHTVNDQVFRGFFTGRYLFSTVSGFLRYASPAGPEVLAPTRWRARTAVGSRIQRPVRPAAPRGTPLLLFIETGAGFPNVDPPGKSEARQRRSGAFRARPMADPSELTLNYGLRWDAQLMPETVDPATTAYAAFVNNPAL